MTLTVDDTPPADEWDRFVGDVPDSHHVQTAAWADVRSAIGSKFSRLALRRRGDIVAGIQVQLVATPIVGRAAVGVAGPQFRDDSPEVRSALVGELLEWAWASGLRAVVIQPAWPDTAFDSALESAGFGPSMLSPQLAATAMVDLQPSIEDIMQSMASKARYNVRLGRRRGVEVVEAGAEGPPTLARLLLSTAERQGFQRPMNEKELALLTQRMDSNPLGRIFLTKADDQFVSGALVIGYGQTALYKRGAWNGERSDLHPNEVMHAHIIEWARAAGYQRYDLDGMDPSVARALLEGQPASPTGVTRFKLKLGATPSLRPVARVQFRYGPIRAAHALGMLLPERVRGSLHDRIRHLV